MVIEKLSDGNPSVLARNREYRRTHKDEISRYNKEYYQMHKNREKQRAKKYYQAHREERIQHARKYRNAHRNEVNQRACKYRKAHPDKVEQCKRKYSKAHLEEERQRWREYHRAHPDKMRQQKAKHRGKGFVSLMDNPFPSSIPIDWHHLLPNQPYVVPMPRDIHRAVMGKNHFIYNLSIFLWSVKLTGKQEQEMMNIGD